MYTPGIQTLLSCGKEDFHTAAEVLLRIARNILINDDEKFRSICITSQTFQQKLLPYNGAINVLMEMGFQEDDDKFSLFMATSINDLRDIHDQLIAARANVNAFHRDLRQSHKEIRRRLKNHFQHCKLYEAKSLQEKARSLIPLVRLNEQAQKRLSRSSAKKNSCFHHCLLLELLAWFKKSFFTWTDAPNCVNCDSKNKPDSIGMLRATEEDLIWGASRVEGYRCKKCSATLRFPRYNHPEKLLETRTGRCGEWANCFTLMCRAVNLEARHVLDWTDHVWTEVYIPKWERWVHCDPCENVCDQPLMYEQGWKKKLSVIVAANIEEIADVTWRYAVNRDDVLSRRYSMFSEGWLLQTLQELNSTMSAVVTTSRRKELEERMKREKEEFNKVSCDDQEYGGRTSGSLSWRQARGETKAGDKPLTSEMNELSAIELTEEEVEACRFHLEYSSKDDEYVRISNGGEKISGWDALIWKSRDVMRKEEMDWEQAYLCRKEGSMGAYISWKVVVPGNRCLDTVSILVDSQTFGSGKVKWLLSADTACNVLEAGKLQTFGGKYKSSRALTVHAFLSGGEGDTAWQKSQLFRQSTSQSPLSPCFDFRLTLSKR